MVVEGFFIVFYDIGWWIRWLGYITGHRYSFRAFMRNEYTTLNMTTTLENGETFYFNGTEILAFYGYYNSDVIVTTIGGDLAVLLGFSIANFILFYLVCEYYWK